MATIDRRLIDKAHEQQRRMRAIGRKGGRATARRHGSAHMAAIGRKGFITTLARHWQGDKPAMVAWLHRLAAVALADALADLELARQLAAGADVACCEIPVYDF